MGKRNLVFSFVGFSASFLLVVGVLFAWFIQISQIDNLPIDVEKELINYYEVTFYKHDSTYKYNTDLNSADYGIYKKWDSITSTWLTANYIGTEESSHDNFQGIIMEQYDPYINDYNLNNNLIIEIRLNHSNTMATTAHIYAMVNTALANQAKDEFAEYSDLYSLSKYSYIQYKTEPNYTKIVGTDTYVAATTLFTDVIKTKFNYSTGTPDILDYSTISLSPIMGEEVSKDVYIYFNLTYNETNIKGDKTIFPTVQSTDPIVFKSFLFFQDINFIIKKVEG